MALTPTALHIVYMAQKMHSIESDNIFVQRDEAAVRIGVMGYVGDWSFSAERLMAYLDAYRDEKIKLEMYSYGGRLVEALAVTDYIQANALDVSVYIFGFCGSAATVVACGASASYMGENSFFFIHNSSNPNGEENEVNETLDATMRRIYAEKSGQSEDQLREWMEAETMFPANQAIELGFVDGLISDSDYLEQAAEFLQNPGANAGQSTNTNIREMDIKAFKAVWEKLFPGKKLESAEDVEATIKALQEQKENGQAIESVQAKVTALESDNAQQSQTLQELATAVAELTQQLANLKESASQATEGVESVESKMDETMTALKQAINDLKSARPDAATSQASAHIEASGEGDNKGPRQAAQALDLSSNIFGRKN